jgi:hypothetical protein
MDTLGAQWPDMAADLLRPTVILPPSFAGHLYLRVPLVRFSQTTRYHATHVAKGMYKSHGETLRWVAGGGGGGGGGGRGRDRRLHAVPFHVVWRREGGPTRDSCEVWRWWRCELVHGLTVTAPHHHHHHPHTLTPSHPHALASVNDTVPILMCAQQGHPDTFSPGRTHPRHPTHLPGDCQRCHYAAGSGAIHRDIVLGKGRGGHGKEGNCTQPRAAWGHLGL